ncbi:RICIN domain-containing protein [Cellvibrio japonicus]|nr:RICIN domain-containing protein [Cellvibrio japonicus]QEI11476.1 family 43 glycosylhydrolase [Cellvibrio japonicus]QEI15050.1 family 43 glycosylhydrolase [Cellvibrio japonicus]QEI18630.1 family 43 glycosylhydrolase [Cellvibrio japonicus]
MSFINNKQEFTMDAVFFSALRRALVLLCVLFPLLGHAQTTFNNPLFANGADPWVQFYQGNYYALTTTWTSQIAMRKSPTLAGLASATPTYIWSDTTASRCCNFWAFEMHRLNGPSGWRWYIIYTAGISGDLGGQRNHVLESEGDDPMGPYRYRGTPMSSTWNIDGTYLEHNGSLYLLWSEWQGAYQTLFIQAMSNPWTVTGSRVAIASPAYSWELVGANVNEAPVVLKRNGRTFVIYSASSCSTADYKLGQLELTGTNPLLASSWAKTTAPVFQQANGVYGPGHNGFFTSPDGTENWIAYHANASASQGCGDTRSLRAQKFTWNSNGTPNFGSPVATSTAIAVPSGDNGPLTTVVRGATVQLVNRNSGLCLGINSNSTSGGAAAVLRNCSASSSQWVLDYAASGFYRLSNSNSGQFLEIGNCSGSDGAASNQWPWLNNTCQQWSLDTTSDGWLRLTNRNSNKVLDAAYCGVSENTAVQQWSWLSNACQEWRIQPVGTVAIVSAQSGKAVEVPNCSSASNLVLNQYEWLDTNCQKWTFTHTDNGYYQVKPLHNSSACMQVSGSSTSAGTSLVQGSCSGNAAQWRLLPQADGTLRFTARHSGLSLDIMNCSIANGATLNQYTWLNNLCQKFSLRAAN